MLKSKVSVLLSLMLLSPLFLNANTIENSLKKEIEIKNSLEKEKIKNKKILKNVRVYIIKIDKKLLKYNKDLRWLEKEKKNKKISKYDKRIIFLFKKISSLETELLNANKLEGYYSELTSINKNNIKSNTKEIHKNETYKRLIIEEDVVMLPGNKNVEYIENRLYPITSEITRNKLNDTKNGYRTLIMRDDEDIVVKKENMNEERERIDAKMEKMEENINELETKIYSPKLLEVQTNEKVLYKVKFVNEKEKKEKKKEEKK